MTPLTHDMGPCALHDTNTANTLAGFVRNRWPDCCGMGGRIRPECLAGFNRNRWPDSIGMGGRNQPEYAHAENYEDYKSFDRFIESADWGFLFTDARMAA